MKKLVSSRATPLLMAGFMALVALISAPALYAASTEPTEAELMRGFTGKIELDVRDSENGPLYCSATFKRNLTDGIYKGD